MHLQVYLNFDGNCEEALAFYSETLGGTHTIIQRYGDAPMDTPDELKQRVLHAQFQAGEVFFMAADAMPGDPVKAGNITLSLDLKDADQQTRIFAAFAKGGKVTMPLEETFWQARFGMVIDRFGIPWMLNHNLPGHKNNRP